MTFPKVSKPDAQGRIGIDAFAAAVSKAHLIWRETPRADVGIDGQIEYVDDDALATARLVAVQAKSGPSWFIHPCEEGWKYYPDDKHRLYWEVFPMPVIIALHDSADDSIYWADARQDFRSKGEKFVVVPKNRLFRAEDRHELFRNVGVSGQPFIDDIRSVMTEMMRVRSTKPGFTVSDFDLFVAGLTNIAKSVYFNMDIAMELAEYRAQDSDLGVEIGDDEYRFLYHYFEFMVSQHLAEINFSDCLVSWVERKMTPMFIAPLTSRGKALVGLIQDVQMKLIASGKVHSRGEYTNIAQEEIIRMVVSHNWFARLDMSTEFQSALRGDGPEKT